ncbi:MAG TPA: hypothetical protein VMC09_10265 [Anaerolineales bacterium]|nr:hypothetical protein [Anaerolineales bacterium]
MSASPIEPASTAFLFVTHFWSRAVLREYKKIERAVEGLGTPWLIFQGEDDGLAQKYRIGNISYQSRRDLDALGYPMIAASLLPGSAHFLLLNFYKTHPHYAHYWWIEYDVRFSGNWRTFFVECARLQADLLTGHVFHYREVPNWNHWSLTHPTRSIPLEDRIRCLHPVMRVSNAALDFLCAAHQDGWCGHSEVVLPSLLHAHGCSLADFGGVGDFVPPGMRNKFYRAPRIDWRGKRTGETYRYRPSFFLTGPRRNKLYHPVKPFQDVWKERTREYRKLLLPPELWPKKYRDGRRARPWQTTVKVQIRRYVDFFIGKARAERVVAALKKAFRPG